MRDNPGRSICEDAARDGLAPGGDRDREGIGGGGSGGAPGWPEALGEGDDGLEVLELLDDGRDGYRLNFMLDCFLTCRPRSEPSNTLPAPSTIVTVSCLCLVLSRAGRRAISSGAEAGGQRWVAEATLDGGIDGHWDGEVGMVVAVALALALT